MKPGRRIAVFAVCLGLLGGGLAGVYRSTQALERDRAQVEATDARRADDLEDARRLQVRAHELQATHAALEQSLAAAQARLDAAKQRLAAVSSPRKPAPTGSRRLSPLTVIANDPARFAAYMKFTRDMVDLTSGASMHNLKLTPEQRERFKDMVVWSQQRILDIEAAAETEKLDRAGFEKLRFEEGRERMKKEAEILGPLEEEFRVFGRMQPVRNLAEQVAALSVMDGTPMSADQVETFTHILSANAGLRSTGWADITTLDWDAAAEKAAAANALTPRQVAFFRQLQQLSAVTTKLARTYAPQMGARGRGAAE